MYFTWGKVPNLGKVPHLGGYLTGRKGYFILGGEGTLPRGIYLTLEKGISSLGGTLSLEWYLTWGRVFQLGGTIPEEIPYVGGVLHLGKGTSPGEGTSQNGGNTSY